MARCSKCGKEIRFIKVKGSKSLIVNSNSVYFLPDTDGNGKVYVMTNGKMRTGQPAPDGIKGFTLHDCGVV